MICRRLICGTVETKLRLCLAPSIFGASLDSAIGLSDIIFSAYPSSVSAGLAPSALAPKLYRSRAVLEGRVPAREIYFRTHTDETEAPKD